MELLRGHKIVHSLETDAQTLFQLLSLLLVVY
jgi:hypothetical protein